MGPDNPDCSMKRAARVDSYRGFVFASLAADGPSLKEFLGEAKVAFDDMCDRSPVGEVEVVPICYRVIQHSNWKFFMENQLDALHPSVTHQSTGVAAAHGSSDSCKKAEGQRAALLPLPVDVRHDLRQVGQRPDHQLPDGHGILNGYMGLRPQDPDTQDYEALMNRPTAAEGRGVSVGAASITCWSIPDLSVQSPLQQLRCLRPLGADRTLSEIWHFRLKGAPEAIYRRSLVYYNLVIRRPR